MDGIEQDVALLDLLGTQMVAVESTLQNNLYSTVARQATNHILLS